jgi:hypothetical protein
MSIDKLKVQILESVGGLDQMQSEKVLNYINGVVKSRQNHEDYRYLKQRAMHEIQVAIDNTRDPQAA